MPLKNYTRIQKRMREQNAWRDEYALKFAPVAALAATYLDDARRFLTMSTQPIHAVIATLCAPPRKRIDPLDPESA